LYVISLQTYSFEPEPHCKTAPAPPPPQLGLRYTIRNPSPYERNIELQNCPLVLVRHKPVYSTYCCNFKVKTTVTTCTLSTSIKTTRPACLHQLVLKEKLAHLIHLRDHCAICDGTRETEEKFPPCVFSQQNMYLRWGDRKKVFFVFVTDQKFKFFSSCHLKTLKSMLINNFFLFFLFETPVDPSSSPFFHFPFHLSEFACGFHARLF
jgi:hypothetical protein